MAVQPQTPYKEYTANGSTNSFALEFDCDNQDHLIVFVDEIEPVVGTWSLSNGSVVFGSTPTSGKKIIILRNTPFRRDGDFQSYDNSFRPPGVNNGFDKIWLKLQELGVADWILSNRIDALKNYVDDRDDELRAYLMEEIRKQGVALDQLEDYYNYLMQRLAQIAVDKGWDAAFVVDGDKTQKQINASLNKDSSLSIESGFSKNNADQVLSFLQFNKMLAKFQPGSEISIEKSITIDLAGTTSNEIDLQGATLNFKSGGRLTIKGKADPYLTTSATSDLVRGATFFSVDSITGIAIGDLISVTSPVVITGTVTQAQTYLVQGVDSVNKRIYVMGCIVGDMRASQITAQGLTGNITVTCYKVAQSLKIKNGKITSLNRDDSQVEILINGFKYVDLTGLTPEKPTRMGVSLDMCGIVNINKCFIVDAGYVVNDQGYNSTGASPGGLSFGYGFLASNCYMVNFANNDVLAGWHGLDVARGVSIANAFNNRLHKGAFGISSHEGQWVLNVSKNDIFGGHAVTCRSFELYFTKNTAIGIRERFIISSSYLQALVIKDNYMEASKSSTCNFYYADGTYNISAFSDAEPIAIIQGNTGIGLTNTSLIRVAKNLTFKKNDFTMGAGGLFNIANNIAGELNIDDNTWRGTVLQNPISIGSTFNKINIDNEKDFTTNTQANTAHIFIGAPQASINLRNVLTEDKEFTVRNIGNVVLNFEDVYKNNAKKSRVFEWATSNTTVQRYIQNIASAAIPPTSTVNYVFEQGNIITSKQYKASKVYDWPSLAAGAVQSTAVTLTGVAVGDSVSATMSVPLNGTRLWAEVTSGGTATVYQQNPTGAAVDLPSGTLFVKCV